MWLHNLPGILSNAGLDYGLWQGWETRSRSSGGYERILGIGVHHDAGATGSSLNSRCQYAWENSSDRPIGALWLHTDGFVMIGAAGATNTQGKGGPRQCTRGTIPQDQGNLYTISIEASNNGVGEPWPTVMQDAYVDLVAALCDEFDLTPGDVFAHFEWTNRKIDPAGNSRYATGGNKWNMDAYRGDVFAKLYGSTPEPPPSGGSVMTVNTWWADPPKRIANGVNIGTGKTVGINLNDKPAGCTVAITVDASEPGYLTVWSGKQARPLVSNLTYAASPNITGQVDTLVNKDGFIQIYANGACKVWVDLIATHS